MSSISKQSAIKTALLLNAPGEFRTYLVCLLNRAYDQRYIMDLDHLCLKLESISKNDDDQNLIALLHYITCLRIENIDTKRV